MLSSMSFDHCSYGDCGRVLPTSIEVAVFLCIFAARASVICIHSLCRGVNGNWFVGCGGCVGEDGPGHGVNAIEDGSGVVATCMMSPDQDWNSSMSSRACKSVSSTQESCAGE